MKQSNWRRTSLKLVAVTAALAAAIAVAVPVHGRQAAAAQTRPQVADARVDALFSKWNTSTPGCAVGVAVDGQPVLTKAYGMADLEHDVKNAPDTIFEAGSVSKQFTAAAVLLLARDGKLSLDDDVRKYIPELPDYGAPLRIRHMLNHTSGLRDWGNVVAIAGWPRTTRVHTHAHVIEIASHQRTLNFPSGTRWSYTNTGYNLSAILVARVSGMSFAEFSRTRIFEPLGMTHTSWRDDYTRVVKNRSVAYDETGDGFHTDMPFENVHGNGGLLTTVADLLKWNENFTTPKVGDAKFVAEQQQVGTFNDGRPHDYALGLWNRTYKGVRQVDHSGATAGYRADLARYPDQHLSVAVLCNVSSGGATQAGRAVADLYLGDRAKVPAPPAATYTLTGTDLDRMAGLYRDTNTGEPLTIARTGEALRIERGQPLIAQSVSRLVTASGQTWELDARGVRKTDPFGRVDSYVRVAATKPTATQLKELAGVYVSDEAETTLTAAIEGDALVLKRHPDTTIALTPVYADAFTAPQFGVVLFHRTAGRVTSLSVVQDRMWDLRFSRQPRAD